MEEPLIDELKTLGRQFNIIENSDRANFRAGLYNQEEYNKKSNQNWKTFIGEVIKLKEKYGGNKIS